MTDKPVGQFVSQQLNAGKQRVAGTGHSVAYASVYPEVARAVLAEYPNLTATEKQAVIGTLKADAERSMSITREDHAMELREASRILSQ